MFEDETRTVESVDSVEASLQELVEYVARGLVTSPDDVQVTQTQKGDMIVYEVRVADDDKGRVIGKNGRTAKALRAIIGAAATKNDTVADCRCVSGTRRTRRLFPSVSDSVGSSGRRELLAAAILGLKLVDA